MFAQSVSELLILCFETVYLHGICIFNFKNTCSLTLTGREGGSGWGTHVYPWWIHVDVWQNQYSIVK